MRWLLVLVLTSCSTTFTLRRGHTLTGPRELAVLGGNTYEQQALTYELEKRGFRVILARGDAPARYAVDFSGACALGTMRVEVFDRVASGDLALVAERGSFNCPGSVFEEVAAELDRLWVEPKPPDLDDPALHRKVSD